MRMNRKGYIYTVISLMLVLVLLAVVSLYYDSYKAAAAISPAKLRTDELHYFVESAKKDTGRAMSISVRRAAAYLTDYVINNHTSLQDAPTALKQLMVNGTITTGVTTFNVLYMQDQTLNNFTANLQNIGDGMKFTTNISLRTIDIYMYDSLHFLVVAKYNYTIIDKQEAEIGVSGYQNENQAMYVMVPIDGLEDPLYGLNTTEKVSRTFNHSTQSGIQTLATATLGNGTGGGFIWDVSGVAGQDAAIVTYNTTYASIVPYTVFVINSSKAGGFPASFINSLPILNASGGVIDYTSGSLVNNGFPYVSGISTTVNFTDKDHVIIKNGALHQVLYLWLANDIKNKLYENSTNGSCFFDRLEGHANLSNKCRANASVARLLLGQSNSTIVVGIESYVNMSDLNASGLYSDITPYQNFSSVDYLYFQNASGKWVYGTPYWFRMDAYDLKIKNLMDYCYDNYAAIWHFDEGTGTPIITYDGSRNAHAATLSSAASIGSGNNVTGLDLTSGSGKADANDSVSETAYTTGLWFKTLGSVNDSGLFSTDDGNTANNDRNIYLNASGNLCADVFVSTPAETICTPQTYNDNAWHYVVHVFENKTGGEQKLYVDGVLNQTGTLKYSNRTAQTTVRVGYSSRAANTYFRGWIDDVKIWNRALSDQEIRDEYQKLL